MSETASASTNTASSASTQATPGAQNTNESANPAQGQQSKDSSQQSQPNPNGKAPAAASSADDGLEEIRVGSTTAKVSKEIAQLVKNLERGFQTKAQEASNNKKLLDLAKSNPEEFYRQTGKDPYDLAEEMLAKKYEQMQMTPEQRRLHELERDAADRKANESASKKEVIDAIRKEFGSVPEGAEDATREQLIQYFRHQRQVANNTKVSLDNEIGDAFKNSGLSPDKHLLAKVAFEMSSALRQNKKLTAQQAIDKVSKEYYSGAKDTFGKMDAKRIHEIFGDEFLSKIQQYALDQVTASAASKFGHHNPGHAPASSQTKEPVKLSQMEWRKAMGIT